ncbi:hypothetical protein [Escherichia coli]|uniref:hypothetical protein n=3 Tax=Escherichia coli TaxID=562 RepID=UPI000BE5A710|nr:hypothetical protein [Escherichia coli]EFG8315796.1 hypothetical protein [Escherichia coli]
MINKIKAVMFFKKLILIMVVMIFLIYHNPSRADIPAWSGKIIISDSGSVVLVSGANITFTGDPYATNAISSTLNLYFYSAAKYNFLNGAYPTFAANFSRAYYYVGIKTPSKLKLSYRNFSGQDKNIDIILSKGSSIQFGRDLLPRQSLASDEIAAYGAAFLGNNVRWDPGGVGTPERITDSINGNVSLPLTLSVANRDEFIPAGTYDLSFDVGVSRMFVPTIQLADTDSQVRMVFNSYPPVIAKYPFKWIIPASCYINSSSNIELNHRELNVYLADKDFASTDIKLRCNTPNKPKITLKSVSSGQNVDVTNGAELSLPLCDGITSNLTVKMGEWQQATFMRDVKITSELRATDVSKLESCAGERSASAVLEVSLP